MILSNFFKALYKLSTVKLIFGQLGYHLVCLLIKNNTLERDIK